MGHMLLYYNYIKAGYYACQCMRCFVATTIVVVCFRWMMEGEKKNYYRILSACALLKHTDFTHTVEKCPEKKSNL